MKRLNLKTLIEGEYRDLHWPPLDVAGMWAATREYRSYYHAHHGERFAHRPDLTDGGGDLQTFTPVPLAREIAAFSAALLFGEPPTITAREAGDGAALEALVKANRLDELLTVSAELVAVEVAGGLRVSLDDGVPGGVVLDYVSGDRILWRERFGRFTSGGVIVFEHSERNETWRLIEDQDVGRVSGRLFKGTIMRLGNARALTEGPEHWRNLKPETATGILDRATLTKWENKPGGVSDLAGILPLLDSYDDAATLTRMKAAASIPVMAGHESLFGEDGPAELWRGILFQTRDVISPEFVSPDKLLQVLQAPFEAGPMLEYMRHLRAVIVTAAGYSPESWGLEGSGGRADSGRALALLQTRTAHTRNTKARMTQRAVSEAVGVSLALFLGRPLAEPLMPSVELTDPVASVSEDVASGQDTPTTGGGESRVTGGDLGAGS